MIRSLRNGVCSKLEDRRLNFCPGSSFASGDVLLEIETDKAQMEVEAQDDGKLFKIMVIQCSDHRS